MALFPINIPVSLALITDDVCQITSIDEMTIVQVTGHLRDITLGSVVIDVKNLATGELVGELTWTSPGIQKIQTNVIIPNGDAITVNVTNNGADTAAECLLTLWAGFFRTDD